MRNQLLASLALLAATPAVHAQFLLVPDWTTDTVALLDAQTGAVVNPVYITLAPAGPTSPRQAAVVGNEIWVTDQITDRVMRFSLDGTTHLGNITAGLDNLRGIAVIGNEVWVVNNETDLGAPGQGVVRFDFTGANLGFYPSTGAYGVLRFGADALISTTATDDINRYTTAGASLGTFHNSDGVTGIDSPLQISLRANGNVLAAGLLSPAGIYEYDPNGLQVNYLVRPDAPRGVHELGNGMLVYSGNSGVQVVDPITNTATVVLAGSSWQFFTPFAGANPGTAYCFGDGSGTACPCTPVPLVGDADKGCPNGFNAGGGKLTASGVASIGNDTLVMTCTLINNGGAVVFQGTNDNGGGLGTAFGDGLRCAAGSVRRMRSHAVSTNTHVYPDPMFGDNAISIRGAVLAPGDRWYQGWYRSGLAHCDPTQNYNLTNGVKITWVP